MEQRTVTIKNFLRITDPDIHFRRMAYPPERGNDCVPTSFYEIESKFGRGRSYSEFINASDYIEGEGVSIRSQDFNLLFENNFGNSIEIKKNQVSLLFSPEYMNNVIEQGGVISVLWGGNLGHLDNVRKLKVFTRDSKLNKLLFRKGHYNSTIFDLNRGKPAKVLKIFKTIP